MNLKDPFEKGVLKSIEQLEELTQKKEGKTDFSDVINITTKKAKEIILELRQNKNKPSS